MKLLIISDAWHPQVNGVVRTLEATIAELQRMGHEVEVVGPEKTLTSFPAPTYPEIRLEFFAGSRLKKILDRFEPDYIHISTEGPLGMAMRRLCLRHRRPFSTAYHTCFPEYLERRVPFPFQKTVKLLTYQAMKLFHAPSGCVMVATPTIEALLRKRKIKRIKRWSRGVNLSLFKPYGKELEAYRDLPRPIYIYVGRVAVEKNLEVFLDADLPGSKVIIGDGPDMDAFKQKYIDVRFLGKRTGEDLARHYAAADVFVFPSKTDTFGLVLLEALACGIPVAAYPVQGPVDILGGKDALLHAVLDEDLRDAALKAAALKTSPEEHYEFVRRRYSWESCTQQFVDNLQGTTPFNLRRLWRFSVALDSLQQLWRRIRTLPKFYPNLYRMFSMIADPLLPMYLEDRVKKGKEDPDRLHERLGHPSRKRPTGKLIWCHGASVGEALSLLPLLEKLEAHPARPSILLTTGTRSSAQVMQKRLPPHIIHQYIPLDTMSATERFMAHWHPDVALITESELWPNLIGKIRRYEIPAALINARISARSAERWENFADLWIAALLHVFKMVLAQSKEDAVRFEKLGAYGAKSVGNLKATAAALPVNEYDFRILQQSIGQRPVWLMASTHEGEEELALDAALELQKSFRDLLTLIVPRHPDRREIITQLAESKGLKLVRRSDKIMPDINTPVYLADTMGEMGLFYKLSDIACIGGSFAPKGGHNPVEAAVYSNAVLFGPDMRNFAEIAEEMVASGAARQLQNGDELKNALHQLLSDSEACRAMGESASAFATRQHAILDRVMDELNPLLDEALI
jgi:3-deoxy-D-manno-octulosonic-acid transferase/glycosyltransferase involved in cell wall biosynthesis